MRIRVVVDANAIMSALLGGKPSTILFDYKFQFVTTEFTIKEVEKYLPRLEKKIGISQKEIQTALQKLPIQVYGEEFYKGKKGEAEQMMKEIDPKDVDVLALSLFLETYLWSQDTDFEKAGYQKLLKTYHFLGE